MIWPRKNKINRSYRNNDLSIPCSKKHNNYIVDYLSKKNCVELKYRRKISVQLASE